MQPHHLKFESKEQYEEIIDGVEWPVKTSVIYPVLTELTGKTLTDDEGNEYPEVVRKEGFFINCLGDYPDCLAEYVAEVTTPSVKWSGH